MSCSHWNVYVQDLATHAYELRYEPLRKADALGAAKRLAVSEGLPFDLKTDVLGQDEEITKGPRRSCLVCLTATMRSFEEFVCKSCKAAAKATSTGAKQAYSIDDAVLPHTRHNAYDRELRSDLLNALCRLTENPEPVGTYSFHCDSSPDGKYYTGKSLVHISSYGKGGHGGCLAIYLSDAQRQAIADLVDQEGILQRLMAGCFNAGKREGSNILEQLTKGTLNPTTFQLEREQ